MDTFVSNLEGLLHELNRYVAEWAAKGFEVMKSRIGRYRKTLEILVELGPKGRGEMSSRDAAQCILMLEEVRQFTFTSARVLPYSHLVASRQAKEMFSGSVMAHAESDTFARDRMFELSIAGLIQEAGMTADVSGIVDIRTGFEGRPFFVECKRPQSIKKLPRNTKEAAKQLKVRRQAEPTGIGIIAISLGKMTTGGTARLNAWDGKQVEAVVREKYALLGRIMRNELHDRRAVSGIIAHVSLAGISGSENNPFVVTHYTVDQLARSAPGMLTPDEETAGRFLEQLKAGFFRADRQ